MERISSITSDGYPMKMPDCDYIHDLGGSAIPNTFLRIQEAGFGVDNVNLFEFEQVCKRLTFVYNNFCYAKDSVDIAHMVYDWRTAD